MVEKQHISAVFLCVAEELLEDSEGPGEAAADSEDPPKDLAVAAEKDPSKWACEWKLAFSSPPPSAVETFLQGVWRLFSKDWGGGARHTARSFLVRRSIEPRNETSSWETDSLSGARPLSESGWDWPCGLLPNAGGPEVRQSSPQA